MIRLPPGSRAIAATALKISSALLTRVAIGSTAKERATDSNGSRKKDPPPGAVLGLNMTAARAMLARDLLEHFEPLSDHRWRKISEAGCAAARLRDARHKVAAHWIGHAHEHDWDSARLVQQRGCRGGRIANQYVGL